MTRISEEYGRTDTLKQEIKRLSKENVLLKQKVARLEATKPLKGQWVTKYNNKMHEIRVIAKNPNKDLAEKLNLIVEVTFK